MTDISPFNNPETRAKAAATRAQNAAAKKAKKSELDPEPVAPLRPTSPLPPKDTSISSSRPSQQSAAVRARWATEKATEDEVLTLFSTIDKEEGMALLARMRKNCESAARALNQQITASSDTQKCAYCGGPKKPNRQWALIKPRRDPSSGIVTNQFFCDAFCVSNMNHKEQGVRGIPDRGMLSTDQTTPAGQAPTKA